MTDEEQPDVLDILSDEHARSILQITMRNPKSANELSNECGISEQSIYRRTEQLLSCGLLDVEMEYDSDGHHFRTYTADPTQVLLDITEEEVTVKVNQQENMVDRFTDFINDVREG